MPGVGVIVGDFGQIATIVGDKVSIVSPAKTDLRSIVAHNNVFVAVGPWGKIVRSSDAGATWVNQTGAEGSHLHAIAVGKGLFVAVGYEGVIFTSPDGQVWSPRGTHGAGDLLGISFGKDLFVAVNNEGEVLTSSDGLVWANHGPKTEGAALFNVAYGNGRYVAVGYDVILTSSDAKAWSNNKIASMEGHVYLKSISYGNNLFIAVGNDGKILTSSDGNIWEPRLSSTDKTLNIVSFINGQFIAAGDDGTIVSSSDGKKWTPQASDTSHEIYGLAFEKGNYVGVGEGDLILTSHNGTTFSSLKKGRVIYRHLRGVTFAKGNYVVVGDRGTIATSPDASTWSLQQQIEGEHDLNAICYGNGLFVAVGDDGTIATSDEAHTWSSKIEGAREFVAISCANDHYVAGSRSRIFHSSDAKTWSPIWEPPVGLWAPPKVRSIAFGNGRYVVVGGEVTSNGSLTKTEPWKEIKAEPGEEFFGVTFANNQYIAVGHNNLGGMIKTSSNGENWVDRVSGTHVVLRAIAFTNGKYVAVGDGGTILTSTDGAKWELLPIASKIDLNAIVFP